MTDDDKPLSHRPRTGSDKRKRTRVVGVRMTDQEYAQLEAAAERKGLTVASYVRDMLISQPQTRSRRRPRADVATLARFCGELNRIGSNINQMARAANLGRAPGGADHTHVMAELLKIFGLARAAMGFKS
jgi:hypothetical protein